MSLKTVLCALADAIRRKSGINRAMTLQQMVDAVDGICLGVDTSDATATEEDLLSGKTAYVDGRRVTGTIPSLGAQTFTPGTSDQIISEGKYLAGAQTIKGDANLLPENIAQGVSLFGVTGIHEECPETYDGTYAVTPTPSGMVLPTARRMMREDLTVKAIPYYKVSNTGGGDTVYIGKELE
ncbi:MAG: hypothetical protein ACI4XW_03735 [Candidatus Spyradocola sp.]